MRRFDHWQGTSATDFVENVTRFGIEERFVLGGSPGLRHGFHSNLPNFRMAARCRLKNRRRTNCSCGLLQVSKSVKVSIRSPRFHEGTGLPSCQVVVVPEAGCSALDFNGWVVENEAKLHRFLLEVGGLPPGAGFSYGLPPWGHKLCAAL